MVQAYMVEAGGLRGLGRIDHIQISLPVIQAFPGKLSDLVLAVLPHGLCLSRQLSGSIAEGSRGEIPAYASGGIFIEFLIQAVKAQAGDFHIGLKRIIRLPGVLPNLRNDLFAVLFRPVPLKEIAAVAMVLVKEMPVGIFREDGKPAAEGLGSIHLVSLPLGALFPESAPFPVAKAESSGRVILLAGEELVAIYHILETMGNLVGDGGSDRLAGGRADPERAYGVVISRSGCKPLAVVVQINLDLVFVHAGCALARFEEAEAVDVIIVEMLGLFEHVVYIHIELIGLGKR